MRTNQTKMKSNNLPLHHNPETLNPHLDIPTHRPINKHYQNTTQNHKPESTNPHKSDQTQTRTRRGNKINTLPNHNPDISRRICRHCEVTSLRVEVTAVNILFIFIFRIGLRFGAGVMECSVLRSVV